MASCVVAGLHHRIDCHQSDTGCVSWYLLSWKTDWGHTQDTLTSSDLLTY